MPLLHVVISAVLGCSPAPPQNHTFNGPGVRLRQTVSERGVTLELLDAGGRVRWKVPDDGVFSPVFSANGRWVAEPSTLHDDSVRVWSSDGKAADYHPLSLATEDEKSVMSDTSCGIDWYGGMRFDGATLVVLLNQAPMRPPIYPPDPTPKLEILIDLASGKMSRRTPPKIVTVESLIAKYRTAPGAQLDAAEALRRKSEQPGGEKLTALATFAKEELAKTKDAKLQAVLLRVLDRTGTDADREWVGDHALEAHWPPYEVLSMLQRLKARPELLRTYSQAVLGQKLGDVNARAEAVRQLAAKPGGIQAIEVGLADPERYVRDAAEGSMRSLPANDETFAFLNEHAELTQARLALVELFVQRKYQGPPNPGLARFEQACESKLQQKWPGCEAWTGAMADARGEARLAKRRYEHALAGITAELDKSPIWSPEVDSFFRLHVRLAALARDAKRADEVEAHIQAIQRAKYPGALRVDCSSGLPRSFDPQCDGGAYPALLFSRLRGQPPPPLPTPPTPASPARMPE